MTCKLYLSLISQINIIKIKSEKYEELCYKYIMELIKILKDKIVQTKQFEILNLIFGTIDQINILNKDKYLEICNNLIQISQNLFKRSDQCIAMINCSKLMYGKILKEKEKAIECLTKAKKYADYAMTSPYNSILFVYIINQYIQFDLTIEDFDKLVKPDVVNDIIEYVKNYIATMKSENKIGQNAELIENYFENTLTMIKTKQTKKLGKIIPEINLGK